MSQLQATHKVIELDEESEFQHGVVFDDSNLVLELTGFVISFQGDGDEMQAALLEWTGQRTVPNVFIGGKHIGGSDGMFILRCPIKREWLNVYVFV